MNFTIAVARFSCQLTADGRSARTRAAYRRDLAALGRWFTPGDQREGLSIDPDLRRITPDVLARFLTSDAVLLTPGGKPRAPLAIDRTKSAPRWAVRHAS